MVNAGAGNSSAETCTWVITQWRNATSKTATDEYILYETNLAECFDVTGMAQDSARSCPNRQKNGRVVQVVC